MHFFNFLGSDISGAGQGVVSTVQREVFAVKHLTSRGTAHMAETAV